MNRTIKFRLWDGHEMRVLNNMIIGTGQLGFSNDFYVDVSDAFQEKSEVMQFTGLKDKNGREIYEGDIIERLSRVTGLVIYRAEVYFDKVDAAFCARGKGLAGLNPLLGVFLKGMDNEAQYQVVGNIYENPGFLQ